MDTLMKSRAENRQECDGEHHREDGVNRVKSNEKILKVIENVMIENVLCNCKNISDI